MINDYKMNNDTNTHLRWWSCVPAWPLCKEDPHYKMLRHVFSDHTTNAPYKKGELNGKWKGFYTEGEERHQVVGIFHNFSVFFPRLNWVDLLLQNCKIEYANPVQKVRWQYELRGCDSKTAEQLHADVALRITDSSTSGDIILVIEAKKRSKKPASPSKRDRTDPNRYLRLNHLTSFQRTYSIFLIDSDDAGRWSKSGFEENIRFLTWDKFHDIQLTELAEVFDDTEVTEYFLELCARHFNWYREWYWGPSDSATHF
jgi:hypothetical protein